ncbi:MAG: glycosyltransferase [Candidatus Helarchaeota archaeon]
MTASTLPRFGDDSELSIVLDIAENIKKYHKNINISILAPHYPNVKKEEIIKNVKIYRYKYFFERLEKLHYNGGMLFNIQRNKLYFLLIPLSLFFQILAIKKIVKKEKIDILHSHWIIPQGLAAVLYKKIFNQKIKIVCTAHGSDVFLLKKKYFNILKRFILKKCDKISVVSSALQKELLKNKAENYNINIINNGINIEKSISLIEINNLKNKYNINSFCLLFVGRLSIKKGIFYLIEAMPKILLNFPKTKLIIVGYGPDQTLLEKKVQKLKLQNHIIFTGALRKKEIFSYYTIANILINPSLEEGFGMVLLEALSFKLPVITTNSGGITDIIEDKKTGIFINQKQSDSIANTVNALLNNEEKRKKLSYKGYEMIQNKFNWKKIALKYYDFYCQLN